MLFLQPKVFTFTIHVFALSEQKYTIGSLVSLNKNIEIIDALLDF